MTGFTVAQARGWRADPLTGIADDWDRTAGAVQNHADAIDSAVSGADWRGTAARAATAAISPVTAGLRRLCRALVLAAAEARDAAATVTAARDRVLAELATAAAEGCPVGEDGTVGAPGRPSALAVALTGGSDETARTVLDVRARELTRRVQEALHRLTEADADAGRAIDAAFDLGPDRPGEVRPAGATDTGSPVRNWPTTSQDGIAAQFAATPAADRRRLVEEFPGQVGNTDGIPWPMRVAANRINIANAILQERRVLDRPVDEKLAATVARVAPTLDPAGAERLWAALHADPAMRAAAIVTHDRVATQRIELYRGLLADVPDPADRDHWVPRQILAFDPDRAALVELSGDLGRARAVGVLVPGLNTTVEGSADEVATARRLVGGSGGEVAMITYLGGRFPTGDLLGGLAAAADPRYALDMAPRLVAFSEDVDRTAGQRPVTYIGHSYGGSIVGTAERFGLTADRVIYTEAAGAGVGVQHPSDWHNRNPAVLRFSMTAPGDPIGLVQGYPTGPHGADPDRMPGMIPLAAGRRLTGRPMMGLSSHSDVLSEPSDAWRNILAVIAGDPADIRIG